MTPVSDFNLTANREPFGFERSPFLARFFLNDRFDRSFEATGGKHLPVDLGFMLMDELSHKPPVGPLAYSFARLYAGRRWPKQSERMIGTFIGQGPQSAFGRICAKLPSTRQMMAEETLLRLQDHMIDIFARVAMQATACYPDAQLARLSNGGSVLPPEFRRDCAKILQIPDSPRMDPFYALIETSLKDILPVELTGYGQKLIHTPEKGYQITFPQSPKPTVEGLKI